MAWLIDERGEVTVARSAVSQDSIGALVSALASRARGGRRRHRHPRRDARISAARESSGQVRSDGAHVPSRTSLCGAGRRGARRTLIPGEPLRGHLPKSGELVVVAPGPLALLPFATTSPFGKTTRSRRRSESAGHRYAPSLAAVAESERRPTLIVSREPAALRTALKNALVVGNPSMPSAPLPDGAAGLTLAALPAAGAEAAWVATSSARLP